MAFSRALGVVSGTWHGPSTFPSLKPFFESHDGCSLREGGPGRAVPVGLVWGHP